MRIWRSDNSIEGRRGTTPGIRRTPGVQLWESTFRRRLQQLSLFLTLLLHGCVADPQPEYNENPFDAERAAVILNEGLWRMDNSSLTLYEPESDRTVQNWFASVNPGERIGDTGNGLRTVGNRLYVVLSESETVEVISLPSGLSLGRLHLPSGCSPRSIAFADDTTAWVSCLDDDAVYRWNPKTFVETGRYPVGPAPEGIAVAAGRLFVANSGLGALRSDEEGAGVVHVLDAVTGRRVGSIEVGGNLGRMWDLPQTGYLCLQISAVLPDTTEGGIVEIDPVTLEVRRRWEVPGLWAATVDLVTTGAYALTHRGLYRMDLSESSFTNDPTPPELLIPGPFSTLTDEVPHSIGVDPVTGQIYVGVARGYFQAPGRVDRYGRDGTYLGSFDAGLNPVAITFW